MAVPATVRRVGSVDRSGQLSTVVALAVAGFHRYATYRQATLASAFTNTIFGFLRCSVLLAAAAASPTGLVAGYTPAQIATYCWTSQGLIGVMMLWGFTELSDRIRTGDIVTDLLRPVHPITSYLAADLGRAVHACLIRFVAPVAAGLLFFPVYLPQRWITYPMFAMSVGLGVLVCFGCRYLLNAAAYWILDTRGLITVWSFATACLAGLAFPLHFLPSWLTWTLWLATPFPSMLQAPLDVIVERGGTLQLAALIAGQIGWAVVMLAICAWVQRRAERKLVIQGG